MAAMRRLVASSPLCLLLWLALADLALAQAGSGSGSFGGGGGGGGGGFSGGGGGSGFSGGSGGECTGSCATAGFVVVALFFGFFGLLVLWLVVRSFRYRAKVNRRVAAVRRASAEAAEDDSYFAADEFVAAAEQLFRDAQEAWDKRDRRRLAELVGKDLLVEWTRRLDDFERKGWHNRVSVLGVPQVQYVGITNREQDEEDRAVVRITAQLRAYVIGKNGRKIMRKGETDETVSLTEYWTLARSAGQAWMVVSIEQRAEGDHQLDEEIVASPWSGQRIADQALTELAVEDKLPEGFTSADLADFNFADDARAKALDLSLADARFMPDVLEAAARRAVAAWAEAVDGRDTPLEAVASRDAVDELLYAGDASRGTRVVVRGPRVKGIRIERVEVEREPATMTVAVELGGRRYVENRDTTTVVAGDKDRATTFTERWTLALDGADDAPWRLVSASAAPAGA
jgi:predicted lipid-binding transport protein (Tim44 family)